MPNKRKRKATTSNTATMWNSSRSSKKSSRKGNYGNSYSSLDEAEIEKMFEDLLTAAEDNGDDGEEQSSNDMATMEGISNLCESLGLDPYDLRVMVLLWKLDATSKPQQISKTEWMEGCVNLQVDSIEKLKELLPSLDTGFLDETEFKDFYKFCFQFNREGTHKTLEKDLVLDLIPLVLGTTNRIPSERYDSFNAFLKQSPDYTRITLDQWTSFWDFCQECPLLSDYDEATSAWPVLIDDYVEYTMKNGS
mmetsp:Transcript_12440/g.18246  ORF Transcript_12440/g.18246 Transcript_12440/m.18246 type:complete len:250 (-) Transcript_12440:95-844(-)|eukprot:CAMPEP_0194209232 /NCGR_PEP_ID=MMETSP0156-20130528/7431_1 /TAXON_ID=33649 /ORGANISM="Thalassionema nitzschioides, Strain L26-B" /LENGTH=249 /DNA_ID=CAMNT_0038936367 /DNA_START=284 /DNA_END=1033 /DNA_ORIENTATION=+